ncbi:hypothetical protein B0H15DRAFT_339927 [Mycena belliarum]|uniref:Uncharacterized protein n=1 Tax=Mycena belliarum TaxID=1033014 RepID=A0AAD6UL95_9AGAR|nr:hypothetical protein B0H15DRAFT_339927 [Mycena belliae]
MPCSSLPDEIISEILSPALTISDEVFSDTSSTSPFALYSGESSSVLLLVSKAWLRVSTPLLYHVVVLRSKAQARALEAALKSNKDLGMYIKKLRVEGGYGSTMKSILALSPKITDLCISLAIWSSDGVSGLCQSLHLIDPVRLILHDLIEPRSNQQNIRLLQTLADSIPLWKNLRTVDLPYSYDWDFEGNRCSQICAALIAAPFLEEVVIPLPLTFGDDMFSGFIAELHKIPPLKSVKIKQPLSRHDPTVHLIDTAPNLTGFVQYLLLDEPEITPSLNPAFVPMESASLDVKEAIWSRVLFFALNTRVSDEIHTSDIHRSETSSELPELYNLYPTVDILLVSKLFKRLSIPYYYRHVLLESPGALVKFSNTLLSNPSYAQHLRSLALGKDAAIKSYDYSLDPKGWEHDPDHLASEMEDLMRPTLPLLNNLISIVGSDYDAESYPPHSQITSEALPITWYVFCTLGTVAGASLQRFCLEIIVLPIAPQSPLVFAPFLALRSLEWKCLAEFSLDAGAWAPGAFANLECLSLVDYHPSFLSVLELAELPALRRVYFYRSVTPGTEGFLTRHGSNLTQVMVTASDPGTVSVLDACPNLPQLICTAGFADNMIPSLKCFTPREPHLSLATIQLQILIFDMSRQEEKSMRTFLDALDLMKLPALRHIRSTDFFWPATEREISRSFWVACAESLLRKNIRLTDVSGSHWTPRLKR